MRRQSRAAEPGGVARARGKTALRRAGGALAGSMLLAAACAPLPRDVDAVWPVDAKQTGLPVLSLQWKVQVADHEGERKPQEFASAAVEEAGETEAMVFIGSEKGGFYALTAGAGKLLWKAHLGAVSSRPLLHLGRLLVGTNDGIIICLDRLDGRQRWRYRTRGAILETPVYGDSLVFVSNEADQVYALDFESGKFRWQYKSETPEEYTLRGHAGVAVDGELLFTGFSNGTVVALRAATGTVAWMTSLRAEHDRFVDVDGTPVIAGSTVYVASSAGGVYALDKSTGLTRWRAAIASAADLAVDDQYIYVAAADKGIYALDLDGNVVWRQGTRGGGEPARPVVSGDYLVYTLSEDGVFVANKRTGELYQYFDSGQGVSSPPTVWGDYLFIMSNGGILYAMSLERFST